MEGWRREMYADDTGSALGDAVAQHANARHGIVYPGTVLFEGAMLSEGRGTTVHSSWLVRPGSRQNASRAR
jgi:uncharacterized protein YbbC (DUF1343 family)